MDTIFAIFADGGWELITFRDVLKGFVSLDEDGLEIFELY